MGVLDSYICAQFSFLYAIQLCKFFTKRGLNLSTFVLPPSHILLDLMLGIFRCSIKEERIEKESREEWKGGGEEGRRGGEYKGGVKGRIIEMRSDRNNTLYKQCPEAPLPPKCLEQPGEQI